MLGGGIHMDDILGGGGPAGLDMDGFTGDFEKTMSTILNAVCKSQEKMFLKLLATMKDGVTDIADLEKKYAEESFRFDEISISTLITKDKKRATQKQKYITEYFDKEIEERKKSGAITSAEDEKNFKEKNAYQARLYAEEKLRKERLHDLDDAFRKKREADEQAYIELTTNRAIQAEEIKQKYNESLHNQYVKLKAKNFENALKEEAAKRGVAVEELTADEVKKAQEVADARMASEEDYIKLKKKEDANKNKKEQGIDMSSKNPVVNFKNAFTGIAGATKEGIKNSFVKKSIGEDGKEHTDISGAANALGNFAAKLDSKISDAAGHKSAIDTRLYGSEANISVAGSYWMALNAEIMGIAGASPLFLQTDLIKNLETLVDSGISHNVKLRAFLMTITDKIATTFEVNDSTMLRLIRMQQQDTTAARMGMESALNAFLNNMFETTEYLSKLADNVRSNLEEAQALMGAKEATEFEYQVQKWMGSMYSVGMSDSTVTNIATTLGQLAAGQIEALNGSGTGNLLIMAANEAGLSIADILKDGLDSETTNKLLEATVSYLAQIAQQSDSKVVQQQLAGVFGMKASDLQSVMNLVADNSNTVKNIANNNLTNEGMLLELAVRAATMSTRVDMATMMNNLWENVQYSMAAGIAMNPAMFGLYKMGGLLQDTTGGIDIPFLNVYGFGVDLNTSVAQLMQVGAMAGGIMTTLPMMLGGIASAAGGGAAMLAAAGIGTQGKKISRGDGSAAAGAMALSGMSTSSSGLVGNASSDDMTGATMASGQDDIDSKGTQGKEDNEDATRDDIIEILKILFGGIGDKIDENTAAVKGQGGLFNDDSTMGGFTNASVSKTSAI